MVDFLISESFLYLLLALILAFITTHATIPAVIRVAREKHLLEEPNRRSSHSEKTPRLGGIAIFASLAVVFLLVTHLYPTPVGSSQLLLPSLIILFFIGLKDDILVIDPYKKLAAQLMAAGIIIACADIRIGSLFGLLGIYELPYLVSFLLTLFIFVAVVNAYNLIDGVDGLAGSLSIVAASVFGVYFYLVNIGWAVVLSATLVGSLISFLRFNYSKENKVFMGDSGSLIVGFVLAVLAITFIQINETPNAFSIPNAPTIAIITLGIPLFDALRVFSQRILDGGSPFRADRNHIHHFMVDNGFSHKRTSMLLAGLNLGLTITSFLLLSRASVAYSFAELMGLFLVYSFMLRRGIVVRSSTVVGPPAAKKPTHTLSHRAPRPVNVSVEVEVD